MKNKKTKNTQKATNATVKSILPRENPNLYGHETAFSQFLKAIDENKIDGGWLLSGPKGIGKATLAYNVARIVLSGVSKNSTTNGHLVDVTKIFKQVSNNSHPNLLVLEVGNNGENSSSEILVDDTRKIGDFLHFTAAGSKNRVVIIDAIDDMNVNSSNAILKLLEEPPANTVFILISHAVGKILPTILSRIRHIKMHYLEKPKAELVLDKIAPEIAPDIKLKLLELADYSPGLAYEFYLYNGLEIEKKIDDILTFQKSVNSNFDLDIIKISKLADTFSGKSSSFAWQVFKILIDKKIITVTKETALRYQNLPANFNSGSMKITKHEMVALCYQSWQEINQLFFEADNLHLDKKSVIFKVFRIMSKFCCSF